MKLVTEFELATKTKTDLYGLLSHAFNELARSERHSVERTNALVSIENIRKEINSRYTFNI